MTVVLRDAMTFLSKDIDPIVGAISYENPLNANTTYTVKFKLAGGNKTELATYNVLLKKDYNISSSNYDVIKDASTTVGSANAEYNEGEFEGYSSLLSTNTLKVLKTIELAVSGGERDLIDLLEQNFGLSALNGGEYGKNLEISLVYGSYKTSINAISSAISLQAKTKDSKTYSYAITPHGAQNDGDIVHLVLSWNDGSNLSDADTYILRIKIIPNNPITLVEPSGIVNVAYNAVGGTGLSYYPNSTSTDKISVYEIPLANLVSLNGISESDVIVAVGEGSQYVVGEGSNKLVGITNGKGIKLKKTIFGGNVIELTISDSFGYSVKVNIVYSNSDQTSPTIVSTPSSIYEGESFTLAFDVGGGNYVVYKNSGTPTWSKISSTDLENETNYPNVIIIGNFDKDTLKALLLKNGSIITDNNQNPTKYTALSTYSLSASNVAGAFSGVGANFISNTHYLGGISISGDDLGLKLVLETNNPDIGVTERVELPISTALNERYQIQLKSPYSSYADLFFGLGNDYVISDLFQIWDLKDQKVVSDVNNQDLEISLCSLKQRNSNGEYVSVSNYDVNVELNKITPKGLSINGTTKLSNKSVNTQFEITLSGVASEGLVYTLTYDVFFTPKYYAISYPNSYNSNYGVVVDGDASTTSSSEFTDWTNDFKLLDYYGNEVASSSLSSEGITLEKLQGTGNISGTTITGLSADSPVTIAVKCDDAQIGTILVTMRRYYKLTGGGKTESITPTSTNTLDFAVWANGIKGVVAGGTTEEQIPSGLSHFDFVAPSGYSIIYTDGEYKLRKLSGNFEAGDIRITVKYLGKDLGTIKVTINDGNVVVSVVGSTSN